MLGLTIVFIIAILGFREFVGETSQPELYDKELGEWASKMNVMLSEPMNDSKLKETNNDEGFEFYLKAQDVIREFP